MTTVTIINKELFSILLGSHMHLSFNPKTLIGIQSWVTRETLLKRKLWVIEFTFESTTIETEYSDKYMWLEILRQIKENNPLIRV